MLCHHRHGNLSMSMGKLGCSQCAGDSIRVMRSRRPIVLKSQLPEGRCLSRIKGWFGCRSTMHWRVSWFGLWSVPGTSAKIEVSMCHAVGAP